MPTYNDNSVPFGSQIVTVGSLGHVAEQINFSEPSQILERFNASGDPSGQVIIPTFANGTAVLQLASSSTTPLTIGATFNLTRNNGSTVGVVISEVSEPEAQFDARKQNISFRRRYGS